MVTPVLRQLGAGDLAALRALIGMFGRTFDDPDSYRANEVSDDYLRRLLAGEAFIALAAFVGDDVVAGIAAYDLKKFEQERSEIYLYDLAVVAEHRRRGIATALIGKLREIARVRGAWVIFVQADTGVEDEPAIALYSKLGRREEVLHFDIPVIPAPDRRSDAPPPFNSPAKPRSSGR